MQIILEKGERDRAGDLGALALLRRLIKAIAMITGEESRLVFDLWLKYIDDIIKSGSTSSPELAFYLPFERDFQVEVDKLEEILLNSCREKLRQRGFECRPIVGKKANNSKQDRRIKTSKS